MEDMGGDWKAAEQEGSSGPAEQMLPQRHPNPVQPMMQQIANSPAQLVAASAAKPFRFHHTNSDVVCPCKTLIVLHMHFSLRILL